MDPDRTLFEQSIELPYDPEWEFPRQRLEFDRVIGSGAFGEVWIANARGINALNPTDKSLSAARRRSRLRINKKIPTIVMNCLCKDELCDEKMIVAVKTLKSKFVVVIRGTGVPRNAMARFLITQSNISNDNCIVI